MRRGLTRVHEARARGIPVLVGSDNVQDPFCRGGSLDPVEALGLATYAAQMDDAFDTWSDSIAHTTAMSRTPASPGLQPGAPADLVCFEVRPGRVWPDLPAGRRILRQGEWLAARETRPCPPNDPKGNS